MASCCCGPLLLLLRIVCWLQYVLAGAGFSTHFPIHFTNFLYFTVSAALTSLFRTGGHFPAVGDPLPESGAALVANLPINWRVVNADLQADLDVLHHQLSSRSISICKRFPVRDVLFIPQWSDNETLDCSCKPRCICNNGSCPMKALSNDDSPPVCM